MAKLKSTDYRRLVELCQRGRGACAIGNNTTARLNPDGVVVVSLHGHDIVKLFPDGDTAWTLAGWPTVTTRERVNQFLPIGQRVFQHRVEQRQCWPAFPGDRAGWRRVEDNCWYRVSELVYGADVGLTERRTDDRGVVELSPLNPAATVCGGCGRGWDDEVSTAWTPTPSGRCPFEYDHATVNA